MSTNPPGLPPLKIYILIRRDNVDIGHQMNCAAHAGLAIYLRFKSDPQVEDWAVNSFRKVTCGVSDQEFEDAKKFGDWIPIVEKGLTQPEVAIVFKPRRFWEPFFKTLNLFGEKSNNMTT